jgi:hypothetical protein
MSQNNSPMSHHRSDPLFDLLLLYISDHVLDPETGGGDPAVDQEVATGEGQGQEVGNVVVTAREGEVQERVNLAVNHDQKARVDLKHTVDPEVGHQMRIGRSKISI